MPNIDTSKVKTIASEMIDINNRYRDDFSAVEQAINRLKTDWKQPQKVSSAAFSCFDEIKAKFFEPSVTERRELAQFLCDAVGIGYEEAENTNKSLLEQLFNVVNSTITSVSSAHGFKDNVVDDSFQKLVKYNNENFLSVKNLETEYFYNQNDYEKFLNSNGENVGCTSTSEAIAYSIYHNEKVEPSEMKWATQAAWGHSKVIEDTRNIKASEAYSIISDYVKQGIPVMFRVRTETKDGHHLTAVGIRYGADENNLGPSDVLVIDPWDGDMKTLAEYTAKSENGYKIIDNCDWSLRIPK